VKMKNKEKARFVTNQLNYGVLRSALFELRVSLRNHMRSGLLPNLLVAMCTGEFSVLSCAPQPLNSLSQLNRSHFI